MFQLRKYLIALIAMLMALTSLAVKADDLVFATVAVRPLRLNSRLQMLTRKRKVPVKDSNVFLLLIKSSLHI